MTRVAALSDLHFRETSGGTYRELLAGICREADVLVICGDLTDRGLPEEAHALAAEMVSCTIPVVGVLGNHDFEGGKQDEVKQILCAAGLHILDGEPCELEGVGFAGVKGFCGGFDTRMLEPWGESIIKQFVREAVDEALKLETALVRLRTEHKVAVVHYAPIRATVEGEPTEIWPFLGSSRLAQPIDHFGVDAVFHGHAHHGCPRGETPRGIPVYNVSMALMRQSSPDRPYVVVDL